jgi:mannose-6-phosphate isomerase-like protein (cupin superfamily)
MDRMNSSVPTPAQNTPTLLIPAGEDRFGKFKTLGISLIAVKVSREESSDLFMVEITLDRKGGPAKHLHYSQDEWFYVVEGDFLIEAGDQRLRMKPGDSLFVRRKTPHVWANVGNGRLRFLASVSPAGKLEAFFENAAKYNEPPGSDQAMWHPYDMEWVGPPLKLE